MVNYDITAIIKAQDKASDKFRKVEKSSKGLNKAFGKLGGAASVAGGVIAASLVTKALGAVTNFVSGSLSAFSDFETSMATVSTLLGDNEDAMALFGKELRAMSEEIPVNSVNELGDALFQVISAGIPASEALAVLETAAKGAKAGVTDTFTAVDGLTTVLNAYQLPATEVNRIMDIFFATNKAGKTTVGELAASMSKIIPTAAAMGVSFEEISAGMATLTAGGAQTTEAATALNAVMVAIIKPSTDMSLALEKMGFESGQAFLETQGLSGAMSLLADFIDKGSASATDLFPNVEALKAVFPLTGAQAEAFAENLESISDSAGATEVAFNKQAETHASKMQVMTNTMQNLQAVLGEALAPALEDIAELFTENKEEIKAVFTVLGQLIKGGIWVAIAAFKGFFIIGEQIVKLFAIIGKAIVNTLDFAFLPLQLIFHALTGNWEAFGDTFKRVYDNSIKPIVDAFKGAMDIIGGAVKGLSDFLVGNSVWTDMLGKMEKQSKDILPKVEDEFKGFSADIGGGIAQINPNIGTSVNRGVSDVNNPVTITGPLINIEGSANEEVVNEAVNQVKTILDNIVIESTSPDASTSRIRTR